ncbi:cell wall-binding repeat-containing protein [Agromyces sp. NPDC058484]|uniref:cell wall-binding repeat-containing protein n=1 Tax=Agromyces sp. NPDC058484 TaxID=3346524 RepID=UPI003669D82C
MTRRSPWQALAIVLVSLAMLPVVGAAPAYAESTAHDPIESPLPMTAGSSELPAPSELEEPNTSPEDTGSNVQSAPTLPPVFWPTHGAENGLIHLTGALFVEAPDGTVRTGSSEVRLMAADTPGVRIATAHGSTFAFYDLPLGREYYLEIGYGEQPVYAADPPTPYRIGARLFAATSYEVPIILPSLATVSGTIGPAAPSQQRYLTVSALRYNEDRGRFEYLQSKGTYAGGYAFEGLFPGRYVFRGSHGSSPRTLSDEYYPDGDHFEDASPIDIFAGDELTDVDFMLPEAEWTITRIAGDDRYETSVEISRTTFAPGVPVLYLASGANWPDALSAGPAASVQGGALLLTAPGALPDVTREEIDRLSPARVVIVGSPASVSEAVFDDVRALVPDVVRIGGVDRFETSRMLAEHAFGDGPYETVFLATGANFPDALSAGPIAGRLGVPVLLVNGSADAIDAATRATLTSLAAQEAAVLGSTASISSGIEQDLAVDLAESVRRFAGTDRYHTNSWLNNVYEPSPHRALSYFANGTGFADALAGATAAAANAAPIYLTPQNCVTRGTLWTLDVKEWDRVVLLGGEPSLSPAVARLEACEW